MKTLELADRLIVAADYKPELALTTGFSKKRDWVKHKVLTLADQLAGTGVCLKINSALRACGYDLINEIHTRGLSVFADLKLFDIKETLSIDGMLLAETKPELLTVVCSAGVDSMKALKMQLPDTEILGVQILTNLQEEDVKAMYSCSINEAILKFSNLAMLSELGGLISSAKELEVLFPEFGMFMTLNTPAIRPAWSIVPGDDQNPDRIMTPFKAIKAKATRIVVGRPITLAQNPRTAVFQTLEEIEDGLLSAQNDAL